MVVCVGVVCIGVVVVCVYLCGRGVIGGNLAGRTIVSGPGGSSPAFLALGLVVNGVDPAVMALAVLAHPTFHHVRIRGSALLRREFAGVRWLMADMNVAPTFTLDCVAPIVTHEDVHIRGILLTLKLPDWRLAAEVPALLDRIRSWGYRDVRACQLAFNRQEFVVAALQRRSQRRLLQRRGKQTRPPNRPPAPPQRHP